MQESTCAQSQDGHERVTRTGEDNAKVGQGSADRAGTGSEVGLPPPSTVAGAFQQGHVNPQLTDG